MSTRLVLASGSPRRQSLLRSVGLDFEVCVTDVDETPEEGLEPGQVVETLAQRKALAAFESLTVEPIEPCAILAADTIVVIGGEVLGKPANPDQAIEMLQKLQSNTHQVFTGYSILLLKQSSVASEIHRHQVSLVKFKKLGLPEIRYYVASGEPLDKAGAYGIQDLGAFLVERIEGSYTNVVGLPLSQVLDDLQSLGVWSPEMMSNS